MKVTTTASNETPKISMRDFFALPEVIICQEIQKRNRYGSELHAEAHTNMCIIAARYGAEKFIGAY